MQWDWNFRKNAHFIIINSCLNEDLGDKLPSQMKILFENKNNNVKRK